MQRLSSAVLLGLLIIWQAGCTDPAKQSAKADVPVKGTVNLDGKQMAKGEIWFSVTGEPTNVFTVTDGAFSGAVHAGKNKVEIYSYKDGPPLSTTPDGPPTKINTVSSKFHGAGTTLSADVAAGDQKALTFDAKTE